MASCELAIQEVGALHKTSLLTPVAVQCIPRIPSVSIIHSTDSENSLKGGILIVMAYYMERIQIKINWGRRCIRQNKEVPNEEELLISSPCGVMNTLLSGHQYVMTQGLLLIREALSP